MKTLYTILRDVPRISREEELALGVQVQEGLRLQQARQELEKLGGKEVTLEDWAEATGVGAEELWPQVYMGHQAREKLVVSHLRLLLHISKKRAHHSGLPPMDMVQECAIALQSAATKFDPSRGFRFITYAQWIIRGAAQKTEAAQSRMVRVPTYVHSRMSQLQQVQKAFAHEGIEPTEQDLAKEMGLGMQQLRPLLLWGTGAQGMAGTLDRPVDAQESEPGLTMADAIPDSTASREGELDRIDHTLAVDTLLGVLRPKEVVVVLHRYGLMGRQTKNFSELAADLHLSQQRIGQIHMTALRRMRAAIVSSPLEVDGVHKLQDLTPPLTAAGTEWDMLEKMLHTEGRRRVLSTQLERQFSCPAAT